MCVPFVPCVPRARVGAANVGQDVHRTTYPQAITGVDRQTHRGRSVAVGSALAIRVFDSITAYLIVVVVCGRYAVS